MTPLEMMKEDVETGRVRTIDPQTLELKTFKRDEDWNLWRIDCTPIKMVRKAPRGF